MIQKQKFGYSRIRKIQKLLTLSVAGFDRSKRWLLLVTINFTGCSIEAHA